MSNGIIDIRVKLPEGLVLQVNAKVESLKASGEKTSRNDLIEKALIAYLASTKVDVSGDSMAASAADTTEKSTAGVSSRDGTGERGFVIM